MAKWLDALRDGENIRRTPEHDLTKRTKGASVSFVSAQSVDAPEYQHPSGEATDAAQALRELRQQIAQARDWGALGDVLCDAQLLFVRGSLTGEQVEALAIECTTRSRKVPEHVPA